MENPFQFGISIKTPDFVGRQREIGLISKRVLSYGQSVALIGDPRIGKTSLLNYIADPSNSKSLFKKEASNITVRYIDAQMLGDGITQADFWKLALQPLATIITSAKYDKSLSKAFSACKPGKFGSFVLEELFRQMQMVGLHLIVILDEFDAILNRRLLNHAEYYGCLRTLASRYSSAFTLIIASRLPSYALNEKTDEFSGTGSPFFNIFNEIVLGPFKVNDTNKLLARAKGRFTKTEHEFIIRVTGGHPFLLQVASSALWEAYEDSLKPKIRIEHICKELILAGADTLSNIWRHWSPDIKKVFTIIAIDEMPCLLTGKIIDANWLVENLKLYNPEIRYLEQRGFIIKDESLPGNWRIGSEVMLWWLADILIRAIAENDDLGHFIVQQQWDGLLKVGEKAKLIEAVKWLASNAKTGIDAFIKAAAEGWGKGMSGGK